MTGKPEAILAIVSTATPSPIQAGAIVSRRRFQRGIIVIRGKTPRRYGMYREDVLLKKLGIPTHRAGMHAFRHGLGTALADAGVSPAIVQRTLRHTDIKTTLRFYVHADAETQRQALAQIQALQM